ncbi:fimbria/pilus periplasmic chaperone [Salmonella enterica]|nr:fimbrial chaperone protein [Salmonella enterica subsp. enterica]EIX6433173.1 fimbria/pilus periplasmic chaperone [Salmonella enterica]
MSGNDKSYIRTLLPAVLLFTSLSAMSAGMVPETTLLVLEESQKGGSITLKNTDNTPVLLYTTITDLPDDTGTTVNVTQPVVRVEPNQQQQLRFILQTKDTLKVEHYKRVVFESIPPKNKNKSAKVNFNIRQDLPILIRPKNLAALPDAWKFLQWSGSGTTLKVTNPSAYVVRLANTVTFLPSKITGQLTKTYILPGETMNVTVKTPIKADNSVLFYPASRYGIEVPDFTAPLTH